MSYTRPLNILKNPPPRLSVELTNICNLHCSYCIRDEDALYHTPARYFSVDLLRSILRSARDAYGMEYVSFTGGEVTIHPKFAEIVKAVAEEGLQFSFVTNGWHFDRVYKILLANRDTVRSVAFSLDGATKEAHDRWRGDGSFVRLVRGIARCHASGIPFLVKVAVRRDTLPQLQEMALFAARLGATALHFSHLLPTSSETDKELALSPDERENAEHEIAILSNVFKMQIGIATGYYNIDPSPPCSALEGRTCNVDYMGRLTLCCNLSGYRGATGESDIIADLSKEDFATAYPRLLRVAEEQVERRRRAISEKVKWGSPVDIYTASPCLFCLQSFGKIPWHSEQGEATQKPARPLPVINSVLTRTGA